MINKLYGILSGRQRRDFYILLCLMLLTSIAELVGTAMIMPFMALAADKSIIFSNPFINQVFNFVGRPTADLFLVYIGLVFAALMIASNGLLLLSQLLMNRYSFRLGSEISAKLYRFYLSQGLEFHQKVNSAFLIQKVMRDSITLSGSLIAPALKLNARIFSIMLLVGLLLYIDFVVAFGSLFILVGVYVFVFKVVRKKIYRNGLKRTELEQNSNRLLNESLEGIKEVKLYGLGSRFLDQFRVSVKKSTRAAADNLILGESPYYLVETIVLSGIVFVTLYFMTFRGSLESILPLLTLYCMAGLKLVPKVQQSYLAFVRVKSAQPVFERLYDDLIAANESVSDLENSIDGWPGPIKQISLKDIKFEYPGKAPLFNCVNFSIEANKITAIVGPSGVGKSTIVEILMGLRTPGAGEINIDGQEISPLNISHWRRSVGYVPQSVYLSDASIAENIAFGESEDLLDLERVKAVARIANIDEFIFSLPRGYETKVGERGAQLSGGQRQRIGIARALYRKILVLILDEATSALDGESQARVMENIRAITGELTVIMVTHREETLSFSDKIIELDKVGS